MWMAKSGAVGVGRRLYVFGGTRNNNQFMPTVQVYDADADAWADLPDAESLPSIAKVAAVVPFNY